MCIDPLGRVCGLRRVIALSIVCVSLCSLATLSACGPAAIAISLGSSGGGGGGGGVAVEPPAQSPELTGYGTATGFLRMLVPIGDLVPTGESLQLVTGYRVSPALPEGIVLEASGTIRGTPTRPSPRTEYTITADFPGGETKTTLFIEVAFAAGTSGSGAQTIRYVSPYPISGLGSICGKPSDQDGFVVIGEFRGELRLGAERFVSKGAEDFFVARFLDDGTLVWVETFGGNGQDLVRSLDTDPVTGAIVVGGMFNSSSLKLADGIELPFEDAGDCQSCTLGEGFVVSLNCDGTVRWARGLYGDYGDFVFSLAIDDGSVWVGGEYSTEGAWDDGFGGRFAFPKASGLEAFVARFDEDGVLQFAKKFGNDPGTPGEPIQRVWSIVAMGGHAIVAGDFQDFIDIDAATTLNTDAARALFLLDISQDGAVTKSVAFDGADDSILESPKMAAFSDGTVILTVYANGQEFDLGGVSLSTSFEHQGYRETIVARFTDIAAADWNFVIRGDREAGCDTRKTCSLGNLVQGIAVHEAGPARFFLLSGEFDLRLDLGPGQAESRLTEVEAGGVASRETRDCFLARFLDADTLPEVDWAFRGGGNDRDIGLGLAVLEDDSLIQAIFFKGSAEFRESRSKILPASSSNEDGLVIRYDSQGRFHR